LLFDPETVALDRLPTGRAPTLEDDGVWGEDPRTATAELGAQMLKVFVERATPLVLRLMR
jgi:creatinine amidohydrolase/Fe(II)-dependent formamide hydrolase-like protein